MASASPRPRQWPQQFARQTWADWPEVKVKVTNAPPMMTIQQLRDFFSKFGKIEFIRIESAPNGQYMINFSPPPREPFWQSEFNMYSTVNRRLFLAQARMIPPHQHVVPSHVNGNRSFASAIVLNADSIRFGTMRTPNTLLAMRLVQATQNPINFHLNLDNFQDLKIGFEVNINQRIWSYRMQVRFTDLHEVHFFDVPRLKRRCMKFSLRHPPKYWALVDDASRFRNVNATSWRSIEAYHRETDIDRAFEARNSQPVSLQRADPFIDTGRWLSYVLTFVPGEHSSQVVPQLEQALKAHGVKVSGVDINLERPSETSNWLAYDRFRASMAPGHSSLDALQVVADQSLAHLDFETCYLLEVCVSNNILNERDFTKEFIERLAQHRFARNLLETAATSTKRIFDPMSIFQTQIQMKKHRTPKGCVIMHSVTVTPTTVYVNQPNVEISNRVVRKYMTHADRFIRVRFQDETYLGNLQAQKDDSYNRIFRRVKRTLEKGIYVAGRHYVYLSSGNSQFREHGAFFFAETPALRVEDIRSWMGKFDHIREIAKYASRLGQCFSTTRPISSIGVRPKVEMITDVERNGFCFTDGVGKISGFLSQMVAQEIKLGGTEPPSLYQFRLGGCKGVLVTDPTLSGTTIQIRPSQKKFETDYSQLEIIRVSSFATAFLNRQIILVLSALGIKDHVFVDKIKTLLADINRSMQDNKVALKMLQASVDFNQVTLSLSKMILDGFRRDPFVASLTELWRAWSIKSLKEKANIAVDQGAFLLGSIDETDSLKSDDDDVPEIFLQIPHDNASQGGPYIIIEGECIIVRNPALHPGDIRVVRAVNRPKLQHLKNVVVFPAAGSRPLANMCAGGDLDGDDYLVMWDKQLIPVNKKYEPMDYSAPKPILSSGPVTTANIIDFTCDYMKNDSLGAIAVAHRAWADRLESGVLDPKCIELAQLHSMAVDYPKTGVPAQMRIDHRVERYPHWLEKPKHKSYISTRILGQLYDEVERVDFRPEYKSDFDPRILNAIKESEIDDKVLSCAVDLKREYDDDMRRLMAKYGIQTEFEVCTAFVMQHNREIKWYKFAEELGNVMASLKSHYRDAATSALAAMDKTGAEELTRFIVTAYILTARQVDNAIFQHEHGPAQMPFPERLPFEEAKSMPLISFPWIFAEELGRIAHGEKIRDRTLSLPVVRSTQIKSSDSEDSISETGKSQSARLSSEQAPSLSDGTSFQSGPSSRPASRTSSKTSEQETSQIKQLNARLVAVESTTRSSELFKQKTGMQGNQNDNSDIGEEVEVQEEEEVFIDTAEGNNIDRLASLLIGE